MDFYGQAKVNLGLQWTYLKLDEAETTYNLGPLGWKFLFVALSGLVTGNNDQPWEFTFPPLV